MIYYKLQLRSLIIAFAWQLTVAAKPVMKAMKAQAMKARGAKAAYPAMKTMKVKTASPAMKVMKKAVRCLVTKAVAEEAPAMTAKKARKR